MATFLLEWFRTDQQDQFEPGGVANEDGKTKYRDTSATGKAKALVQEQGQKFQRDVNYFENWYMRDRGMSRRECYIRMSQQGIVGYYVWRVAIDLPDGSPLDEVFDWYMVQAQTELFEPRPAG